MPVAPEAKRDTQIRVKLTPHVNSRLSDISDELGLPPATVAAFVLGQWVRQVDQASAVVRDATDKLASGAVQEVSRSLDLFKAGTPPHA